MTGVPEAYLWVTVEGRAVDGSQLVHAKGGTATVEIPIVSSYAPNFFLTAVFLKNQRYYAGTKSIKVPPVEQQLAVEVKASKPEYKPGESGAYSIDAKDSAGRPVAAEFSLGVVDEAIYAIRRESVQDILAFFFGRKWNRVNTDTSLSYYFQGEAGKRRMQLARSAAGQRRWPRSSPRSWSSRRSARSSPTRCSGRPTCAPTRAATRRRRSTSPTR